MCTYVYFRFSLNNYFSIFYLPILHSIRIIRYGVYLQKCSQNNCNKGELRDTFAEELTTFLSDLVVIDTSSYDKVDVSLWGGMEI